MAISRRWQTETGLASGRGSTGALDPIDAAQTDIAGSKDLIASVNDDISQHNRWLETYHSDELKHARRVKRQEVLYQAEFHSRRFADLVKRVALFLWVPTKAACLYLFSLISRGVAWLTPYAQAAATVAAIALVWLVLECRVLLLASGRWSAKALSWLQVKGGALARDTAKAASIASDWLSLRLRILARQARRGLAVGWAWSQVHDARLARASAYAASAAFTWLTVNGKALALDLGRWLSTGADWLGTNLQALSRAALATAGTVSTQAAMKYREISRPWSKPATPIGAGPVTHQALAPRPSTTLAIIEPPRAALPAVQEDAPRPQPARPKKVKKTKKAKPSKRRSGPGKRQVNSHAGRASP